MREKFLARPILNSFSRSGKVMIEVENGVPPFTWTVTGSDFTFDNASTNTRYNFITASATAENNNCEEITITDAKGSETTMLCCVCDGEDCCEKGDYFFNFDPHNISLVQNNHSILFRVLGGCPPFQWSVSGAGFSFKNEYTNGRANYLSFDGDLATLATITVTDNCGNNASAYTSGVPSTDDGGDVYRPGDKILGVKPTAGDNYPRDFTCVSNGYEFYWLSETPVEISAGDTVGLTLIGGVPLIIWFTTDPDALSFYGEGQNEAFYYQPDTDYSNLVTLHSNSALAESTVVTIRASDACLKNPMHPAGIGLVQVTILTCCDELPSGEFEFDTDNNPTTIASGGSADIYIQGGCPPYTYTCSGLGATWHSNGSTSLVSNNLVEQLDLADGICGVDYAATITVSATDFCESSTGNLVLRATGDDAHAPNWIYVTAGNYVGYPSGSGCKVNSGANCYVPTATPDEYISSIYKWELWSDMIGVGVCLLYPYNPVGCNQGWTGTSQPPWGPQEAFSTVHGATFCSGDDPCIYKNYKSYTWGCT